MSAKENRVESKERGAQIAEEAVRRVFTLPGEKQNGYVEALAYHVLQLMRMMQGDTGTREWLHDALVELDDAPDETPTWQ